MAIDWEAYRKKAKKRDEYEYQKNIANNDIAPAPVTTILTGDDIAPPVTTKKDDGKRTFFQKSEYFADGKWDKGDLTKTILGSLTDLGEKVGTGGIGSGEKILDFLTAYGTMQNKQQTMKNAESELLYNYVTGKETEGVYEKHNAFQKLAEKEASEFIAKDLYDESAIAKKIISAPVKEKTGVDSETASVFAEKSDELAIAAGDMAATKIVGTIFGGPMGLFMTGASSGGSEMEEALKQGATFDEAVASGMITAGMSVGSGSLFNGVKFGGETLTEGAIQKVASAISSKTLQTLTKWGINTVGEGVEEVIEDAMSSVGKKLTYLNEKEFNEIFNSETAWESFLGGIILGGMFEGVDVGVNKIKGTDYVSGSTKSEQNTLNKLVEERVSEATKEQAIEKAVNKAIEEREAAQGGKFTDENKKALRETVMAQIESGEIDISSEKLNKKDVAKIEKEVKALLDDGKIDLSKIEEILTPDVTKEINELKETLNNTKDEQKKAEIEGKIKQLEKTRAENLKKYARENKYLLKAAYETEMATESYADDSEITDDYEKAVVESAKRNANNTTETRKYVDVVRKLAKDKQTRYVFTNNQELLEQGDLVARDDITPEEQAKIKSLESQLSKATTKEAKADIRAQLLALKYYDTGGLVRKNDNGVETVLINVDSIQSKYSVVGHETKHTLEKYGLNEKFNEVLFEYAKSKGDLDTVKNRIADIYKNHENVDIDGEVAAELTGKYLFEDEKFLETLMKNKSDSKVQQVINKIKELIDDLVIRFKGTEQEKQLREVQKKFTELYNSTEADIVGETTEGTQYGLSANAKADVQKALKEKQFAIIQENNPMWDEYHTGIRSVEDINTWEEILGFNDESIGQFGWGDFSREDAEKALKENLITVYSSHPIEKGTFVSTSYVQAREYAGGKQRSKVYSKTIPLNEVAWINGDEGQYAPIETDGDTQQYGLTDIDGNPIDSARISTNEIDTKYSLSYNTEIAEGQSKYLANHNSPISVQELEDAQAVTNAMVDVMMKYSSILPEDKIGKVLTKNGSYDRSVENTTICVRTLAYNEFVDKVQEEIGRPLTQMESFLVSQKLYDIATEPQCLYCYVSLDRKAFNDMLLRYMQERDTVIDKYKSGKWDDLNTYTEEQVNKMTDEQKAKSLYCDFLRGRKSTKNTIKRFNDWLGYVDNGVQLLSLADISTEARQSEIANAQDNILKEQLKDARAYAQSASWSKIQKNYVAYRDEILKLGDRVVKNLNEHYGLRWYSFSDYSAAFIVENMQQITDASIRGLKGLSYTKDTDYAEIFAPSGMNINISVFVNTDANGNFFIDEKQSANFEKALELREKYPNVGIVATVTNDEALRWAGEQEWSDVIIPFHIVRTGTDVAEYYKWLNYTSESGDTIADKDMWSAYLDSLNLKSENARKKVSKNIYPNEHKNDKATYLALCESRGLSPRFVRFAGEDWYMKLVNETRLSADESSPLKPTYNLDAAQTSFQKFIDKGGYEGGWYRDGVDVDAEVKAVADDVLAGKKANEVDYGRQDGFAPENIIAGRKTNRSHSKASLSKQGENTDYGKSLQSMRYNDGLPIRKDIAKNATTTFDDIAPMTEEEAKAMRNDVPLTDADVPPEIDIPMYDAADTTKIDDTTIKGIGQRLRETLSLTAKETKAIQEVVQKYSTTGLPDKTKIFDDIKEEFGEKIWRERNEEIAEVKRTLKGFKIKVSDEIKSDIPDYSDWKKKHQGRLNFSQDGLTVDDIYMGLSISYPGLFPDDIINPTDQLLRMAELAENDIYSTASQEVDNNLIQEATDIIYDEVSKYKENELTQKAIEEQGQFYRGMVEEAEGSTAKTVKERIADEVKNARAELLMNQQLRDESQADYEKEISRLQAVYNGKRDKNTKSANNILRRIERLQRMKSDVAADYSKRIGDIENRIAKLESKDYATVEQRKTKQQELKTQMENLVGDTSTWVDKKLGISYKVNTLRRNLRDIVRDANGKRDIAKADAIYDELQGKYNHNEAELNRESNRIKQQFAEMKITKAEDTYIQMLGELRHNPETTLTEDVVKDFYNKHKKNIDEAKVDKAIEMARPLYDELLSRVNQVLSEQGMKEIPYRKGYFPHFTEDKQGFLAKLLNWKTKNNDIPTDIAGLTEEFSPNRSWQSFNKQRKSDVTDYSFLKGLDTYVQGSLDWIYHIEDIQKRRALENHIRYIHSEQGIKDRIDAIRNNEEYDANEMQDQIDIVYKEAGNPLNNFITDFRTATNTLAGKKSSLDRGMEEMTNRKFYSTMTNLSNRVSANMVGGSISSALTNFIPITQSWGRVSPISSLRAMGETIVSTFRDDGTINKSDFLTNRLRQSENLYKTNWDKIGDGVGFLMESIDSFTSQTIWRSKYHENISKGMSENAAIKNADQFAENVLAGRSRGNNPTIFDSKNPLARIFTVFQLEVNNQYGYMFKDMPQDLANESKAKLAKGYATMFLGAYVYNALYSSLVGRDAAFDPIGIIEDLLRDLGVVGGDDEEEEEIEPTDVILNLTNNIVEELPFVGGLLGGGRIPLSSALPYGGIKEAWEGSLDDWSEGNIKSLTKEWLNPVYYLAMPMGGGQIKKFAEGVKMFDDDLPIAGSYTDSGNLRFPVEDTPQNRVQAALFGQYANENARAYFDNDRAPLKKKQIQEFVDLDLPIADYWKVRDGLKDLETLNEKGDYIGDLDLPISKKNILINNIADRDKPIDYKDFDLYSDFEEFDFATRYPEKYKVLQEQGVSVAEYKEKYEESVFMYTDDFSWASKNPEKYTLSKAVTDDVMKYKQYTTDLYNIKADKDSNGKSISGSRKKKVLDYINNLDIDYGAKCILLKSEYSSEDRYNKVIVDYLIGRDDMTYEEKKTILEELGATVDSKGYIHW